ncbi:MAG: hypothetical protein ACRD0Z_05920 [Acidimicrobiales bacterium]
MQCANSDRAECPGAGLVTDTADLGLPPSKALVVTGAPNWKPQDRFLAAEVVRPVVVVSAAGVRPVAFFDRFRDRGVSAVQPGPAGESVIFALPDAISRVSLDTGEAKVLDVPDLDDIHEVTLVADAILIANTGKDEVVELDSATGDVRMRHSLARFRSGSARPLPGRDETFHLNQAFTGEQGQLMVLVHHAVGFRLLAHAQRHLVRHGSGGVLDLQSGHSFDLRLFAPHNVRRTNTGWLVNNSGRHEVLLLTPGWEPAGVLPILGFGRGACLTPDGSVVFAGISATRKRYATPGDRAETGIQAVPLDGSPGAFLPLQMMEQVNNVEMWDLELADRLLGLPAG